MCKKGHKKIAMISGKNSDQAVGGLQIKGATWEALADNGIKRE